MTCVQKLVLVVVGLLLAGCGTSYRRARFNIGGEPGVHVFAVTVEKHMWGQTTYEPIRMQHVVSGADGSFSLLVPTKDKFYFTQLYASKPGFRLKDVRFSPNAEGAPPRHGTLRLELTRAGSTVEEQTAVFDLSQARFLWDACPSKQFTKVCRSFAAHLQARRAHYRTRLAQHPKPRRPQVVGRSAVVADWQKLRPQRHPVEVVTAGDHIVALETYLKTWYIQKYGAAADDLMFFRHHPKLRKNLNLVVLSRAGTVLHELELAGTAPLNVSLAPMSDHQVALLTGKGDLRVFDLTTRTLGAPIRLEQAKPTPTQLAITPTGDTIYVIYGWKVLHQYNGAGKLLQKGPLEELDTAKQLAVTPQKACLIFGELTFDDHRRDLRLGDLWATGRQTGVLRVTRGKSGWSVSELTRFVSALWATKAGFWVYREKLVPQAFHALSHAEQNARHTYSDYRDRLYLYSYDGELLRSVDQTDVVCAKGGAQIAPRPGLVTTQSLRHQRCGDIDRIHLPPHAENKSMQ